MSKKSSRRLEWAAALRTICSRRMTDDETSLKENRSQRRFFRRFSYDASCSIWCYVLQKESHSAMLSRGISLDVKTFIFYLSSIKTLPRRRTAVEPSASSLSPRRFISIIVDELRTRSPIRKRANTHMAESQSINYCMAVR